MKVLSYFLCLAIFYLSSLAYSDEPKPIIVRGDGELAEIYTNDGGTLELSASFGDPDDCATSGALVCGGEYVPVVSAESGVAVTAFTTAFQRLGGTVFVCFRTNTDPTGTGAKSFELSLPIASNLGSSSDLAGSGSVRQNTALFEINPIEMSGSVSNDTVAIIYDQDQDLGGATSYPLSGCFSYRIL